MKIKLYKNGASVTFEKEYTGMYKVQLRAPSGELIDKVRCDDYRMSCDYQRSFKAIARGM